MGEGRWRKKKKKTCASKARVACCALCDTRLYTHPLTLNLLHGTTFRRGCVQYVVRVDGCGARQHDGPARSRKHSTLMLFRAAAAPAPAPAVERFHGACHAAAAPDRTSRGHGGPGYRGRDVRARRERDSCGHICAFGVCGAPVARHARVGESGTLAPSAAFSFLFSTLLCSRLFSSIWHFYMISFIYQLYVHF